MDKTGFFMEKTGDHIILFQIIKMFLNSAFVYRFGRSNGDFLAIYSNRFFQMNRVNTVN